MLSGLSLQLQHCMGGGKHEVISLSICGEVEQNKFDQWEALITELLASRKVGIVMHDLSPPQHSLCFGVTIELSACTHVGGDFDICPLTQQKH